MSAGRSHIAGQAQDEPSLWLGRWHVLKAIALIFKAQFLTRFVPLSKWSESLGEVIEQESSDRASAPTEVAKAKWLAGRVRRAAARFPSEPKCLVQAMALQWLLSDRSIPSRLVVAQQLDQLSDNDDAFHAWVELGDELLIGDCDTSLYRRLLTIGH